MQVCEVIIRSNAKSAAFYFGNPAETRRRFHDGFFYTNDLGTWDENHYFHIVGRKDDIAPGEIVTFDKTGNLKSEFMPVDVKKAHCIFEYIYFARLDSKIDNISVYEATRLIAIF